MSKHTPEPWYAYQREHPVGYSFGICNSRPCGTLVDEDGSLHTDFPDWNPGTSELVARTYDSENAHANATRIVACVNACKGINPEAVPDLLEACKEAKEWLVAMTLKAAFNQENKVAQDEASQIVREVSSHLSAAIAKAEGGAA